MANIDELKLALRIFLNSAYPVSMQINPRGWNWSETYLDQAKENAERLLSHVTEELCPGHVASADDPKVCAHCGVHIDSLRPSEDEA